MVDGTTTGVGDPDGRSESDGSNGSLGEMVAATLRSGVLGFTGLAAIYLWSGALLAVLGSGNVGTAEQLGLSAVALGLGTGTVALLFMVGRGYGLSYLDFRIPSVRDWGYVIGGVVALFALQLVVIAVLGQLGVGTAQHNVEQTARQGNPDVLLVLIPASWLLIGPGEELLYRNIIQKSLYDTFSERGALVVASVVFALAHIPAYAVGSTLTATVGTLVVIFFLSLVLGYTYLKTDNLTVSSVVHGTFDAIIFGFMYVSLAG